MLKQFFKDSFIYSFGNVISRGIGLILLPLYTQVFSPAEYGVIDILNIVAALVSLTVALEITQAVALFYASAETENDKVAYASTALWFSITMYGLFVLVALGFSERLSSWILESNSSQYIFQIAVLYMCSNALFYFLQNQLRWQLLPKHHAVSSVLFTLVSSGTTVILVLVFESGVIGVFYGLLIGGLVGSAIAWYFIKHSYKLIFSWRRCKEMLRFSSPLVPSGIAVFVYLYVDRFAIKELMTLSDVGLFGVGYRVASVVWLLLFGFQSSLTALIFHNYKKATTPNELARMFRYFLALVLPAIVGLGMFSIDFLRIFTAPEYYPAWQVIPLLAAAVVLFQMNIFAPGLSIAKQTKSIAAISIVTALLNIMLNFALIPLLGISGAALATLTSAAVFFSLYMILSQKLYFVPHEWGKIATSAAVASLLCSFGILVGVGMGLPSIITISIRILLLASGILFLTWLLVGTQEVKDFIKDYLHK